MPNAVIVHPVVAEPLLDLIAARYDVMVPRHDPFQFYSQEQKAEVFAWVVIGLTPFGPELREHFPNLKGLVCYGTGYDALDIKALSQINIAVCNSPNVNAAAVADQAVTLMLSTMRNIPRYDAMVRNGQWYAGRDISPHIGMQGQKVGIYGMGAIGRKIAARVAAFECEVHYHSRHRHPDATYPYHETLESLVEWCDVLHLAVRAGEYNRHVIDAAMLKRLGPKGFVVNVARGHLIDEGALLAALREGTIAGAGLDVLQNEPDVRPEFFSLPNVVLCPHRGGHTIQAHQGMQACVMENLAALHAGRPPPYLVAGE